MNELDAAVDMWKDGKNLVIKKGAKLPMKCIKTNNEVLPKDVKWLTIYWHPAALYLFIFLNPIIYILVALIIRKSYQGFFPVSEQIIAKRKKTMAIMIGGLISFLITFIGSIVLLETNENIGLLLFFGSFLILIVSVFSGMNSPLVKVIRIGDEYVWFGNVHSDYLESLPEWAKNI